MGYNKDNRIVMTLDAGGTNFVFNAVQSESEILEPITLSAKGKTLDAILKNIVEGFNQVRAKLPKKPVAISFAFPGPTDYENGIIGDLQNLPLFRGGVALGPMLHEIFGVPVFINNDGDLFAFGEAISGMLPDINKKLEEAGNPKRYRNILGVTFGTGFGGGIVTRGELFRGDNSAQGEINRTRNRTYKDYDAEESVSIRGVMKEYANVAGINMANCPDPKEIFEIGLGHRPGNQEAAVKAYESFAIAAGDAIANAITLVDGIVVIGGGLSGAYPLFLPKLVAEMNEPFDTESGNELQRMEIEAFNLEDTDQLKKFLENTSITVSIPLSERTALYDPVKKTGIGVTRLGTSQAVSIGAYAFALCMLDK